MPSKAHLDLQHRAVVWLASKATQRGVRAGFEIQVAPSYVADVAALLSFQYRYAKAYGLLEECQYYSMAAVVSVEPSCVFEVKVSRADFKATFGPSPGPHANRMEPVADLHWVVAEPKVAKPEELPIFWGLLVRSGCGLCEVRQPKLTHATEESRLALARELLWHGQDARPDKAMAKGWWAERRRLRYALEFYDDPKDRSPEDSPGDRARAALAEPEEKD